MTPLRRGDPLLLDKELLDILACPLCKTEVRPEGEGASERLVCSQCGRRYPVRDGIPVMLIDEAELPASGGAPALGR